MRGRIRLRQKKRVNYGSPWRCFLTQINASRREEKSTLCVFECVNLVVLKVFTHTHHTHTTHTTHTPHTKHTHTHTQRHAHTLQQPSFISNGMINVAE